MDHFAGWRKNWWVRGQLVAPVPLDLDRNSPIGLTRQLVSGLRRLMDEGRLTRGDALPSSRALAARLELSRGTVVAAYDQLQAEGYLVAASGSGTRVAADAHVGAPAATGKRPDAGIACSPATASRRDEASHGGPPRGDSRGHDGSGSPRPGSGASSASIVDLRPGTPDVSAIVSPPWRRAWRDAAAHPDTQTDPLGLPALRIEIAEHLRLMRSLVRPSKQILVTSGTREGLALLLASLRSHSGRVLVGIERPGHPALSGVPLAMGLGTLPLPTDEQGLVTTALPLGEHRPDVLVVTPSHQYPHGGWLSLERRQELLVWARRTGTLIVEDDYDSELRYVGMPLPALATLDDAENGCVVLLGTFSTVLTPAVATGYLVAPNRLVADLASYRRATGLPAPAMVQQALAGYLASGELRRHIQRMRRGYRQRRALILAELGHVPAVQLAPLSGGLHAVVNTAAPGMTVIARLAGENILVGDLGEYWGPHSPDVHGIVFGFGSVPPETLSRVLPIIAACCSMP